MTSPFRMIPFAIKLSEGEGEQALPKKVQLMRTCKFTHPKYKTVEVTRQLFSEMIKNFKAGVRGIELMIDYAHRSQEEAAGWIKDLEIIDNQELGESELWAVPDWTPTGARTLSDKEYAYLSADFDPAYKDPETGKEHGAVLLGAGLTNRPVIKKMNPVIQLSESELYKENSMTEEEIKAAEQKFSQIESLMKELGVSTPEELMAKIAEMKAQNTELNEQKQLSEKRAKTDKLFSEGKLTKAQTDEAVKLNGESFESFIKLAEMNTPIKTTEKGHGGKGEDGKTVDPQDKIIELAEAKAAEKKISMTDAISIVLSENADLRKAYHGEEGDEEIEVEDK